MTRAVFVAAGLLVTACHHSGVGVAVPTNSQLRTVAAADPAPIEWRAARPEAVLEREQCEQGDGARCNAAAVHYATGTGAAHDPPAAAALFRAACDAGDLEGCVNLGI